MIKRQDIYDMYWYFACERQNVFYNKLNGKKQPYTNDIILQEYKFCNCYRVLDRVSQFLLRNVIYNGREYSSQDIIFRIVLFKIFNKEQTWIYLENKLGDIKLDNFSFDRYNELLLEYKEKGNKIYNDAYISCANKAFGYDLKHQNHLALIEKMFFKYDMQDKILKCKDMKEAFCILRSYPLIGDFMAYQLVTDINYSDVVNFKENTFTVAGPGAKRGIKKCFIDLEGSSYEDVIKYMYDNQQYEFERLNLKFKYIKNRKLQYIDIQNLFCELDKYLRVYRPDLKSNRIKIKKKYVESKSKIDYVLPPTWNAKL